MESVERGFLTDTRAEVWQTCTCIGDWHYNRARFRDRSYMPAKAVLQRLVDVVSKNGVLLLSIPLRGDGSIDSEERAILADMAAWMSVNGEAIHGSRPWRRWGEGPARIVEGMHGEGQVGPFTAEDIRFTAKGGALYAIAMDWPAPGAPLAIRALGRQALGRAVGRAELVGGGPLPIRQADEALYIETPQGQGMGPALRLPGLG
ncbi:MAG: alpha-L-fucosidase [Terricaulis sp.]|nr:alpha-L-fucosidase [Terricaulis sp.]